MECDIKRVGGRDPGSSLSPSRVLSAEASTSPPESEMSLARAVRQAVQATDGSQLRYVARRDAGLAYEPKTLLALLSYCYARDILGSADVEDALRRDANFRQLCNQEFPGARLIRRFRRENREALQRCLASVLRSLAGPPAAPANGESASDVSYTDEASRRMMKAVFIDSVMADED